MGFNVMFRSRSLVLPFPPTFPTSLSPPPPPHPLLTPLPPFLPSFTHSPSPALSLSIYQFDPTEREPEQRSNMEESESKV